MTRTIADLKLFFEVLQGPDIGDPSATPVPVQWPGWLGKTDKSSKPRIGYFEDDGRTPVTPETRAAVRKAAELLRNSGFEVEPFCPDGLDKARELWWNFFGIAGAMLLGPVLKGREGELSRILREFNDWVAQEPPHTAQSLLNSWIQRDMVRMLVFEQMQRFPVLLCPVASVPAFKHGERNWEIDGKSVRYLDAWSYCEWFNLLGMPSAVLPISKSKEGLPIGVQIVTQPWQEEVALSVAEILERERGPWAGPPVQA
jgi:amidase